MYQYVVSEGRHVLIWPGDRIQVNWCHQIVALNHRRLKSEVMTIHQALAAMGLIESGVIGEELIESCRMQSQEIAFVKRMREVVYAGA